MTSAAAGGGVEIRGGEISLLERGVQLRDGDEAVVARVDLIEPGAAI